MTTNLQNQYSLISIDNRLELHSKNFKPFYIDFNAGKNNHRRLFQGKELLAKAVACKKYNHFHIIDSTAGLGRDAFMLASLGCNVTLIERSPILFALLEDALFHAANNSETAEITTRMTLLQGDAKLLLPTLSADIIYMDPMYPETNKSALVKKEMRILRELVGNDDDIDSLFKIALQCVRKRVVVKRPRLAEYVIGQKPDFNYVGKSTRFDVYINGGIR